MSTIFVMASKESWSKVMISSKRFKNSGAKVLFRAFLYHAARMFIVIRAVLRRKTYATAKFLQLPRTDIGGHNDNRILEIDGSAIIVSQTAFIQYRSKMLNTSGWAFSISSSKTMEYGLRRTFSVNWPPSS